MKDNTSLGFENLYFVDERVAFKDVATGKQTVYQLADIYKINNDDQETVYVDGAMQQLRKEEAKARAKKADTLYKPYYPTGVYKTKEEFIARKPSVTDSIEARELSFDRETVNYIPHNCYFYTPDNKKIRNVFAVSYKGHLYFQIKAILNNRNKTDRAQGNDLPNSFVRVLMGGDNYLYTEAILANIWAQGVAYGAVGGAVGAGIAQDMKNDKGVVWDYKNAEFNIFKNCKDFNAFIQPLNPALTINCDTQQPEQKAVRNAVWKVK